MLERTCNKCNITASIENFYTLREGKYGYMAICKKCYNERQKIWRIRSGAAERKNIEQRNEYWKDPEKAKIPNLKCREKHREFLYLYCIDKFCVDCGTGDIRVLEFDHVRGEKKFDVGKALGRKLSSLQEEITKCDLRCRNCHWIRTLKERNAYKYHRYNFDSDNELLPEKNLKPYFDNRTEEEKKKTRKPELITNIYEKDKRLRK